LSKSPLPQRFSYARFFFPVDSAPHSDGEPMRSREGGEEQRRRVGVWLGGWRPGRSRRSESGRPPRTRPRTGFACLGVDEVLALRNLVARLEKTGAVPRQIGAHRMGVPRPDWHKEWWKTSGGTLSSPRLQDASSGEGRAGGGRARCPRNSWRPAYMAVEANDRLLVHYHRKSKAYRIERADRSAAVLWKLSARVEREKACMMRGFYADRECLLQDAAPP